MKASIGSLLSGFALGAVAAAYGPSLYARYNSWLPEPGMCLRSPRAEGTYMVLMPLPAENGNPAGWLVSSLDAPEIAGLPSIDGEGRVSKEIAIPVKCPPKPEWSPENAE